MPLFTIISLMGTQGPGIPTSANGFLFVMLSILVLVSYLLALIYIWLAPIKLLLHFYDTKSVGVTFGDFFKLFSLSQLFRLLGTFIIYGIAIALGLIVFVIPGIYLAVKLQFALYYGFDQNMPIMDAFKKSYAATTGNFWRIFLVDVIAAILVQLVITIPVSYMMSVYMYRKLG